MKILLIFIWQVILKKYHSNVSWQCRLDPWDMILRLRAWMNWVLRHENRVLGFEFHFLSFQKPGFFKYSSLKRNFRKTNYYFLEEKDNNNFFSLRPACVTLTEKTAYTCIHQAKKDTITITILSLCISTYQHPSPSRMQMFVCHEPSLVALALMSFLWLSGRASGQVTRRLWVRLLLGTLRFLSDELPVWQTEKNIFLNH